MSDPATPPYAVTGTVYEPVSEWDVTHPGERLLVPSERAEAAEALLQRLLAANVRTAHGWHGTDQRAMASLLSDVEAHMAESVRTHHRSGSVPILAPAAQEGCHGVEDAHRYHLRGRIGA